MLRGCKISIQKSIVFLSTLIMNYQKMNSGNNPIYKCIKNKSNKGGKIIVLGKTTRH